MLVLFRHLLWLLFLLLAACSQDSVLDRINHSGELLVGTRMSPTTQYMGAKNTEGPEFDLVKKFAEQLGLKLNMRVFPTDQALLQAVANGQVHMAAAGIAITPQRLRSLRFSIPYDEVDYQLLYRRGNKRPGSLQNALAEEITLATESPAHHLIQATPESATNHSAEVVIENLNRGIVKYTIVDSNRANQAQRYYSNILSSPIAGETHQVAWAFSRAYDDSLIQAANRFIAAAIANGQVQAILDRYYKRTIPLNFVDRRAFWQRLEKRLPKFKQWFISAGESTKIDWRLLAAIGYQESHWNPDAISPTGVQGLMMLTRKAATAIGVTDRTDPEQSIRGGARYILLLDKKIPQRIVGDDRLWFTLAAYNVGYGHLEDARILTQRQGGNPDRWADVASRLPLLSNNEYYSTVKNGYARGSEPVRFVKNIRFFYEMLVWWDNNS